MARLSDLFFKEDRTPQEDDDLRVLLDSIDSVAGVMSMAIGPSGDIQKLRAGNVQLDTSGIRTVDKTVQIDRRGITIFPGASLLDINKLSWELHDDPGRDYLQLGVIVSGTTPNRAAQGGVTAQNESGGSGSGQLDLQAIGEAGPITAWIKIHSASGFEINKSGADLDTIIGGDTDTDLVHADASAEAVGIGVAAPAAKLDVDQASSTGAKPVLRLDQADIDQEFLKLVGSSEDSTADRSLVDVADMTTAGALVGWFQVYVEDVQATNPIADSVYYVPFYAAPSA